MYGAPGISRSSKGVAATEPQRSHTPESYTVDYQPTCDGGRGRLDARYQYRRKAQSPLGAFYRGLQLLLEATAYADSSTGSADQNCAALRGKGSPKGIRGREKVTVPVCGVSFLIPR
jgi:hypothetical protein